MLVFRSGTRKQQGRGSDGLLAAALALALGITGCSGENVRQAGVQVDGSSTVFPISEAFAEEFQATSGTRVTVGLSGTGGGFKKFCRGDIDVTGASRPITEGEREICDAAGIEFIELPVAMDALANIVHPDNDWAQCMSVEALKRMWEPAAQGQITNWQQVDPSFPDRPLNLFGAGTDSGTYDYYTQAIVGEAHASRGDFTATEDDNVTIQGVSGDVNAFGFLGLAYLDQNRTLVKAVEMRQPDGSCVAPSVETARDASYQPLSRPLFIYVNAEALATKPAVRAYAEFMMDAEHAVPLVAEVGYVPLPDRAFPMGRAKLDAMKTGSSFESGNYVGVTIEDLLQ